MRHRLVRAAGTLLVTACWCQSLGGSAAAPPTSSNPILPGWYADPDVVVFARKYWIYPTTSDSYDNQTSLDAFSSSDLVSWNRHPRIIDSNAVTWARRAMWAPCAIEKDNKYYLFFSANDVHPGQVGGIGVAVSASPAGPFKDLLGKPLINEFHNGAQPIDQCVFRDARKQWWIVYGGWGHCNIARLADDFKSLVPIESDDPTRGIVREITPQGYVEGPMMFFRNEKVYFMWSEGAWTNDSYRVAYAIGDSVLGPFKPIGTVFEIDSTVGTGAGHHSMLHLSERNEYYIIYHRRPQGVTHPNHRTVCIDRLEFNADGTIKTVKMTTIGVEARPIKADQ